MREWINIIDGLLGEDRAPDDEHPTPVYDFIASLIANDKYDRRPSSMMGEGASLHKVSGQGKQE